MHPDHSIVAFDGRDGVTCHLPDGLGSLRGTSDDSGALTSTANRATFGTVTANTGAPVHKPSTIPADGSQNSPDRQASCN